MRKLLEFRRSPNCIKVRIALKLKELEFETEEMSSDDRAPMIEAASWPLVPVLIDGDVVMRDSEAILHYLECNYADRRSLSLHVPDALREAQTAKHHLREEFAKPALKAYSFMNKRIEERDPEVLAELNRAANRGLAPFEDRLSQSTNLFSDHLTIDDIIVACNLMLLRVPALFVDQSPLWSFFDEHFSMSSEYARLISWYDGIISIDGLSAQYYSEVESG